MPTVRIQNSLGKSKFLVFFKDEQKPALLRATKSIKEFKRDRFPSHYYQGHIFDIIYNLQTMHEDNTFRHLTVKSHDKLNMDLRPKLC